MIAKTVNPEKNYLTLAQIKLLLDVYTTSPSANAIYSVDRITNFKFLEERGLIARDTRGNYVCTSKGQDCVTAMMRITSKY